jgi:hypothetical protein
MDGFSAYRDMLPFEVLERATSTNRSAEEVVKKQNMRRRANSCRRRDKVWVNMPRVRPVEVGCQCLGEWVSGAVKSAAAARGDSGSSGGTTRMVGATQGAQRRC